MKKLFLFLTSIALVLTSCNDDNLELQSSNSEKETQVEHTIADDLGPICSTQDLVTSDSISGRVSYKGFYWKQGETIRIKFLNGSSYWQNLVKTHANEWTKYANLKFQWVGPNENADIKIKLDGNAGGGSSAVGTSCRGYAQNQNSMTLGLKGTYDQFKGVVLHEFGHALSLGHEHQNPTANIAWNKPYVYNYFISNFNWTKDMVDAFVFNKFSRASSDYSYIDAASIMIYHIPKSFTTNGFYSKENNNLSIVDKTQIGLMYPFIKSGYRTHALYRYWNPVNGDHFYTTNWGEIGYGRGNYKYEFAIGYLQPTQVPGTVPLHRYWNASIGDHFYTTTTAPLGDAKYGWIYEGYMGYIYTSNGTNRMPLYRYWNATIGDHFYTANWNELKGGNAKWKYEGIVGYLAK